MNDSDLEFENAWNAKVKIAKSVIPILEAYKNMIVDKKSICVPSWVTNESEELCESEMIARWLDYLDKMIEAFQLEISGEFLDDTKLKVQYEGLRLFAKYYHHLWD